MLDLNPTPEQSLNETASGNGEHLVASFSTLVAFLIVALFMVVFLLECMSTDIVATVVYAIPYIIAVFFLLANAASIIPPLRRAVLLLATVIAAFVMLNLLKAVICD